PTMAPGPEGDDANPTPAFGRRPPAMGPGGPVVATGPPWVGLSPAACAPGARATAATAIATPMAARRAKGSKGPPQVPAGQRTAGAGGAASQGPAPPGGHPPKCAAAWRRACFPIGVRRAVDGSQYPFSNTVKVQPQTR